MQNWYCTLNQLKAARRDIPNTDTRSDDKLMDVIEDASRIIEDYCGSRYFYVVTDTRYFTAGLPDHLLLDEDLLSVTSLKSDDGSRTYPYTWATTDYDLNPSNALRKNQPYWEITRAPFATHSFPYAGYGFPRWERGVQIVGEWGYYKVLQSLTTLSTSLSDSATTVTVPTGKAEIGQTWLIDSEQMFVSDVTVGATDTVTLNRGLATETGLNGTTRASHLSNAAVSVYTYPSVTRACILEASRLASRSQAVLGVLGMPAMGTGVWVGKMDAEAMLILAPFVRHGIR